MLTREQVLSTLRRQMKEVLLSWDEARFDSTQTLNEMGVDSLDSVLVLMGSLKELGVKVVSPEKLQGRSVEQIVDTVVTDSDSSK